MRRQHTETLVGDLKSKEYTIHSINLLYLVVILVKVRNLKIRILTV